jgi:hypothetical protein
MPSQQDVNTAEETTTFRSIPRSPSGMSVSALPAMPPLGLRPLGAPKQQFLALHSKPIAARVAPQLTWKVDACSIPAVPDYPLERTHMTCDASLTCDQITERIARVLEAQNLQCTFDDSTMSEDDEVILPGRIDCSSQSSDLKLVVQLWRDTAQQIVVEVQRRRGDAMEFSAIRRPLFRTLESSTGGGGELKRFSPPPFVPNKRLRVLPSSMARSAS